MKDSQIGHNYNSNSESLSLPRVYIRPSSIKRNKQYKMKTQQSMGQNQLIQRLQKQLNLNLLDLDQKQKNTFGSYLEQTKLSKQQTFEQLRQLKMKSFGISKNHLPSGLMLRKMPIKIKLKQRPIAISSLTGPAYNFEQNKKNIKRNHSSLKKLLFNLKQANLYNQAFQRQNGYKSRKTLSQQHKQLTQNQKLVQKLLLLKPSKDISRQSQLASYRQHQKYKNIMSHSCSRLIIQNSKQKLSNKVTLAYKSAKKKLLTNKKQNASTNTRHLGIKQIILLPKNHIGITINKYTQPKIQQKSNKKGYYHKRHKTLA